MLVRRLALGILAAAVLLAGLGCRGKAGAKTYPVKGTVTLDDKPVGGALVQFMPIDDRGRPARGMTRSDGTFTVATYKTDDGAVAGTYKVLVSKPENPGSRPGPESKSPAEMKKRMMAVTQKAAPSKTGIPAIYGSADTDQLSTVPTNGPVELKLRSNPGR